MKISILCLSLVISSILLIAGANPVVNASNIASGTTLSHSVDQAKAISVAASSPEFQSLTRGLNYKFNTVLETVSASSGTDILQSVSVVYSTPLKDGHATNVVVAEDPSTTRVTGVTLQENVHSFTSAKDSAGSANTPPQPYCLSPQPFAPAPSSISPQDFCGNNYNWSVSVSPSNFYFLPCGSSATATVTVTTTSGFPGGYFNFGISPYPYTQTITASFNPNPIWINAGASSGSTTMTLSSSASTPPSSYDVSVQAWGPPGSDRTTDAWLNIPSPGQQGSSNWSGYEFMAAGCAPVYQASTSFSIPTLSIPSTTCDHPPCDFAVWTGLTSQAGGANNYIVQSGSDSTIQLNAGGSCCSLTNQLWIEFLPNGPAFCTPPAGHAVNAGDAIQVQVTNHAMSGGDATMYDVSVTDQTNGWTCNALNVGFGQMGTPYFAQFVSEVRLCCTVAQFTTTTMSGTIFANGQVQNIANLLSNWNRLYVMARDGTHQNISVGTISTATNSFPQNWLTSTGS